MKPIAPGLQRSTARPVGQSAARAAVTARERNGRIGWVDYARGLAIVLVVYGHSFRGVRSVLPVDPGGMLAAADYLIYCFHMPVFFMLAGVFAGSLIPAAGDGFWSRRLPALAWPYLLWMGVELGLLSAFSDVTTMGAVGIHLSTFLYHPISPFWFLYALMGCQLLARLVAPWGRAGLAGVSIALFCAGQLMPVPELVSQATWGLLYFTAGHLAGPVIRSDRFAAQLRRVDLLALTTVLTLGLGWACHTAGLPDRSAVPVAVAGCLAVFCLAAQLDGLGRALPVLGVIRWAGTISLTILVVHVLGTAGMRIVLNRGFGTHAVWVHLVAGTASGLGLAAVVQLCCGWLGIERALGLPRWTPAVLRSQHSFRPDEAGGPVQPT